MNNVATRQLEPRDVIVEGGFVDSTKPQPPTLCPRECRVARLWPLGS